MNQSHKSRGRKRWPCRWAARGIISGLVMTVGIASAQDRCRDLKALSLEHAEVVSATLVESHTFQKPSSVPASFRLPPATVPAHCEVHGIARPTSDSEIHFEVWLPSATVWNGKYLQRGNGGWAGTIASWTLITPVARGYAAAATDDGHTNSGPGSDASFAVGHPQKLIDFGFRAVHETATQVRAILRAYYDRPSTRSYFAGCSDGGREALMEAQRFPEDFNGILAGAPANNWTKHFTGFVWNEKALGGAPNGILPATKLRVLQKAALDSCDALDGVKDGLIEDPRKCHIDLAKLQCTGAEAPNCLTPAQIGAVQKIYGGPVSARTGEQIYPGYEPGTEASPGGWSAWILGPTQAHFGNSLFSQAVYENTPWDWHTADLDRDLAFANEKVGWILNAYSPDLRSFRAHGGKLIQYHGWGDAAIAPRDSIAYYNKVEAFLKQFPDPRSRASGPVQDFYRLFMVPGMGHCYGGVGPNHFGNDDIADPTVTPQDAEHDLLFALDRWITEGMTPDRIVATGERVISESDNTKRVKFTRPLCPYPQVARYQGTGDTNEAGHFACANESSAGRP